MDILLNTLQKFEVSQAILNSLDSLELSFMDLIINTKREVALRKGYKKTAINRATFAMENMFDIINTNLLNNPLILINFNTSKSTISKMNNHYKTINIEELETMISNELYFENSGNVILARRNELQFAIKEFREWQISKDGQQYLTKLTVLLKMFEMKKAEIEELASDLDTNELTKILEELVRENYLIKQEEYYYFPNNIFYFQDEVNKIIEKEKIISLESFLSSDTKDIELLKERLNGKTLQLIADNHGLTRERIRQKIKKIPINLNDIIEIQKYASIFGKYNFSENDFILLFNENIEVYNMLNFFCERGIVEPKQYVLNMDIPITKKVKFFDQNQYIVTRNGQVKKVGKLEFFEEVLYKHRDKTFTPEEFYSIYQDESQIYSNLNLSLGTPRAIEGLCHRSLNIINSNSHKFRYFEVELPVNEIENMNRMIALPNGIYNMRKLLELYPEFMEEIGIYDEYELHNLYKKNWDKLSVKSMELTRSPEFIIGNVEKVFFVKNILNEFSGENLNDVVKYMYEEYGLRKNSMTSYIQMNFKYLLSGQKISAEYEKISSEKIDILRNQLVKDIYLRKEVEDIILDIPEIDYFFSNQLMHDIGYYVTGNIVFSKKYGNVREAISAIVLKNLKYIRGDSPLDRSEIMGTHLVHLERDYKIVCISENTYMQTQYLEKRGITKKILKSFVEAVIDEYHNKGYFSFPQIVNDGFKHPLMDFGFEDIFYDRLIITKKNARPITRFTPMIFIISENSRVPLEIFLSDILVEYPQGVYLDDLIDDINTKYYQNLSRDKVKEQLKKYGAFYSRTLDKFYFYKEQYLDEVYGK